jgi:transposase
VIVDHTHQRVLEVLPDREKATVLAYLQEARRSGLLAEVEEVTTDMWTGYVEAAREAFGEGVRTTIDRFHVMQNFHRWMDDARREIQRGLHPEAAKALKNLRWLLCTNPENLSPDERGELDEIKRLFPDLGRLHDLRESLRAIFEDHRLSRPATAIDRLRDWIATAHRMRSRALDKFCRTLENWLGPIANYFVTRASNGRTEGFNHKLRAILWRAFGIRNFRHFRLRVLDACGQSRPQPST